MTILANIKQEQLRARKDRDSVKATLLTTLIGDAVMVGKNDGNRESTDVEVVGVIKKFITSIKETIKLLEDNAQEVRGSKFFIELEILQSFLPVQISQEELTQIIDKIIIQTGAISIKDIGKIMKALKEQHSGKYDGAQANALIKAKFV